jgi:hypothetical protein
LEEKMKVNSSRYPTKLIPIAALIMSSLLLPGCKSPEQPLPRFKITRTDAIPLPGGGGKVILEGVGATPGKDVLIQVGRNVGGQQVTPQTLGPVTADAIGVWSYNRSQPCLFPAGELTTAIYYVATDTATARSVFGGDLGREFLKCSP